MPWHGEIRTFPWTIPEASRVRISVLSIMSPILKNWAFVVQWIKHCVSRLRVFHISRLQVKTLKQVFETNIVDVNINNQIFQIWLSDFEVLLFLQFVSTSVHWWWPTVGSVWAWTLSTSVAGAGHPALYRSTVLVRGWTGLLLVLIPSFLGWVFLLFLLVCLKIRILS